MSNELNIRNLSFLKNEYTDCCFLFSCIKYTWKFVVNNNSHTIFLFYKKFLGKRQIFLDNKKIYSKNIFTNDFCLSFPVEYINITILQKENYFIMKINDISFNKILNDIKLKKFSILENDYKIKQEKKKQKILQKRKNKILLKTIKNIDKIKINCDINNFDKNNNNNIKDDDSKTIHQSFEINQNDLELINKYNANNNDKKGNNNKKINKNIKNKYNIYENIDSSMNDMIEFDLERDDDVLHNNNSSENIGGTNIYRNNNNKKNKDSTTTQS